MPRKKKTGTEDLHPMHPRRVLAEWRAQKPVPGDMGPEPEHHARVYRRDFWGPDKLELLKRATWRRGKPLSNAEGVPAYVEIFPTLANGYAYVYPSGNAAYAGWAKLDELLATNYPGVTTARDSALLDEDRPALEARMKRYFNPSVTDDAVADMAPALMKASARFDPVETRRVLLAMGMDSGRVIRCLRRPFDAVWLYWHPETKLLDEKRSDYLPHVGPGNIWLTAAPQNRKAYSPPIVTTSFAAYHVIERGAKWFPLFLRGGEGLFAGSGWTPNLGPRAAEWLRDAKRAPLDLFHLIVALTHAPAYARDNAEALRLDWPRVPLPTDKKLVDPLVALGAKLAALLDLETPVAHAKKSFGIARAVHGGAGEFEVRANWGYVDGRGSVMPGQGDARPRDATDAERKALGLAFDLLGPGMRDVYLDERAHVAGVPEKVWSYTLGGYLVLKKWLSYRERAVLGRNLRVEEVEAFCDIARRIASILALGPDLDRAYEAAKA
ncbi:MAG: type ISP restriction/modification enzyme [Tagaea sp.]